MFPFRSSAQLWRPFAPPGQGAFPFPDFTAPMGPSDSLSHAAFAFARLRSSLKRAYPERGCLFCVTSISARDRPCMYPQMQGALEVGHRASVLTGVCSRNSRVSQGNWVVLFGRASVEHPAGLPFGIAIVRLGDVVFQVGKPLDVREVWISGLIVLRLGSLACLRINRPIAATTARLATGWLARPWPDGACTHWTTRVNFASTSSTLLSLQPFLVASAHATLNSDALP